MIVRLSEPSREKLLKTAGAGIFAPMPGRPMREYVTLPDSVIQDKEKLRLWVTQALEYDLTLKPKASGKSSGESPAKKKRSAR